MCYSPITLKRINPSTGLPYIVPCGHCPPCRERNIKAWAFRLEQEQKRHLYSKFVTLTYNNVNIPRLLDGKYTLKKSDIQNFFKKLRREVPINTVIKYYVCGEYGEKRHRPHYHAIIFSNIELEKYIALAWSKGHIDFGEANLASTQYALKYISKEKKHKRSYDRHTEIRQKEFSLMSKNMGINYLTDPIKKFHKQNIDKSYVKLGVFTISLPRYYRKILWDEGDNIKYGEMVNIRINKKMDECRKKYSYLSDLEYYNMLHNRSIKKTQDYFNRQTKLRKNEEF